MGLFEPVWQSDDREKEAKAVEYVRKTTNQAKLAKIAEHAPLISVRQEAARKLDNPERLIALATKEEEFWVRERAMSSLPESMLTQEMYADLVIHTPMASSSWANSVNALDKLTDQAALLAVINADKKELENEFVRWKAVCKLSNQAVLAQLVKDSVYEDVRATAAGMLSDNALLIDLARNDSSWRVRRAATLQLADYKERQEALIDLLNSLDALPYGAREGLVPLVAYIDDKDKLVEYADKKWYEPTLHKDEIRERLIEMGNIAEAIIVSPGHFEKYKQSDTWKLLLTIQDKDLLRKIAQEAKCDRFRWKACKLSGGHVFDETATNKCKCVVCGLQQHTGGDPENCIVDDDGRSWICERCGGRVHTPSFTSGYPQSSITYDDGSSEFLYGYDGMYYGESELFLDDDEYGK